MAPAESEPFYLVMDLGGHAGRAAVLDGSGTVIVQAVRPVRTLRPKTGYVEHDPNELVASMRGCMAEVAGKAGKTRLSSLTAALATQRSSIVCWDTMISEPLSPVISWQDTRAEKMVSRLASRSGDIHRRTGLFLSAHYGASKLRWCLENVKEVIKAREDGRLCLGPVSSFVTSQLTRRKRSFADPVNASRTLLFNIRDRGWDEGLLQLFGIPAECLPACVPAAYDYGEVVIGKAGIPLTLVTGDQSAALYASGDLKPDTAYINMGTGAFLSRCVGDQPVLSERLLTGMTWEGAAERDFVLEGTVNGAGSALEWVGDRFGMSGIRNRLPAWLRDVEAPPLFMNGISGLGSPYWRAGFTSGFQGEGGGPEKVVAVVESILFLIYRNLLEMERYVKPPARIYATGGLSGIDGVCRKLADLAQAPVYRPHVTEATVRGACFLAAGKPGYWPEPEPGMWFYPGRGQSLRERYERWVEVMEERLRSVNSETSKG